jgi:nucleotide-binding universal stress UspA family protein
MWMNRLARYTGLVALRLLVVQGTMSAAGPPARAAESVQPGGTFAQILVCLDQSPEAEVVLPIAMHLAGVERSPMTLLHVIETPPAEPHTTDMLAREIVRQEACRYLDAITAQLALGLRAKACVAEGSTARHVAALSAQPDHLTVLATHGHGGIDAWKLGSTAQKIVAVVQGPLLVVPVGARPPQIPLRRILVPLDGSLRSESVLPIALRLARADGAEVVLVHVVSDPVRTELLSTREDLALAERLADRLANRAESYLRRVQSRLVTGSVRSRTMVRRAVDHREGLVALAAAEQADLIVVSAHGAVCNPKRRFGSVTTYVMGHSTAPVLVIQDLPRREGRAPHAPPSRLPTRSRDGPPDES